MYLLDEVFKSFFVSRYVIYWGAQFLLFSFNDLTGDVNYLKSFTETITALKWTLVSLEN